MGTTEPRDRIALVMAALLDRVFVTQLRPEHALALGGHSVPVPRGAGLRQLAAHPAVAHAAHPLVGLLSYVMFDGQLAQELIQLGYADGRARPEDLCSCFNA